MTSERHTEREIDALLGALPRQRAGAGFTGGVLHRLEPGPRTRRWRLAAVAVAAGAVLVLLVGVVLQRESGRRAQLARQMAELRQDHAALTAELRRLRDRMSREQPVLYLGGDDRVDYVLDLRHLVDGRDLDPANRGEAL